jgi:hypothetical protein
MDIPTLQSNLRFLIANTSMELVHSSLTQIMKEDYEFLQKLYSPSVAAPAPAVAVAAQVVPAVKKAVVKKAAVPPQQTQAEEPPRIRADTKVRIVKKPTAPEDLTAAAAAADAVQPSPAFVHAESGLRDAKDQKKWQKEQEDKKMQELRDSGVNPASLLTEANMRKWIVDEKKTFAAIAREYVGLPDTVIAAEAKKHGLQSDTSKRRAMIAANKGRS